VAETCRQPNETDTQLCFDVTTPFLICIKHNGDDASKDSFKNCYLNDVISLKFTSAFEHET